MGNSCLRRVGCLEAVGLSQGFQLYDDRIPEPDENSPARGHADRPAGEVVDLAIRWLSGQDDKRPFFVWVHLYDPTALINRPHLLGKNSASDPTTEKLHTPTARSENFWQRAEKGLLGNTILAVLSDHDESLGQHGESSHGVFLYDATLRIPFILVGPGIPAGKRVLDQARTIDLLPTILEFLVGDPPKTCQGVSLLPTFLGKKVETDYAYAEALFPKINMGWAELRAIRANNWKYVPGPELYDLQHDPNETENVIQSHPWEADRMKSLLKELLPEGGVERITPGRVSPELEKQLRSLGYASGGSSQQLVLKVSTRKIGLRF